jgi:Subtilase family
MMQEHPFRSWLGALIAAAVVALLAITPVATAARLGNSPNGALPPQLAGLTAQRLLRDGDRVLAYARFNHGAVAGLDALKAAGAQIVDASPRYQTVTIAVKPTRLDDVANVARVANVTPVRPPIVSGAGRATSTASSITPCFGAATSEGDLQLNAMAARDGFEVDGSGVKVGILSDSFNRDLSADTRESADIASGDLPGTGNPCGYTAPVQILDDSEAGGEDEGRAMAQIVHDLAPGAEIAFASAFGGELSFAENIKKLSEAGASVIADDVFYTEEPFFQDGPVAVAVDEAVKGGATYLSAAGNDNLIDSSGRDIGSWEAPEFRDSGSCPAAIVVLSEEIEAENGPGTGLEPSHCMDFNPGVPSDNTFGITVEKGETLVVDLQWAEPWQGVSSDLDAYLLSAGGKLVKLSAEDNSSPAGTQKPLEELEWENNTGGATTVKLAINRYSGSKATPLKFALLENGGGVSAIEYPESSAGDTVGPTIFGHSGTAEAISVGAAPYFDSNAPEDYSSHGPVTHYFGPVTGATPAEPLAATEVIPKPDVTATDGGANTFFGACQAHVWRFYGTSAAAPHAAAVAALELDAKPGSNPKAVREALIKSAVPMGKFPPEAVGAGLVDAPEAIAEISATAFPGGTQFAPLTPQNCNLPSPPGPQPEPASPPSAPGPSATTSPPSPPRTFIRMHPHRVIRTRQRGALATFVFSSDESGVSFACRIDGGLFRPCPSTLTRRFGIGWHTVRVIAFDAGGARDPSPASYRFRVKRID